jgi:ribonuclease P protein component
MASARLTFPPRMRLRRDRDFQRVYAARRRADMGAVALYALANDLPHARIGVSLPRKVGNAVRRNRIKRLLREAFRLAQHELPGGLDLVIVVRPHEPKSLHDYQQMIRGALATIDRRGARERGHGRTRPTDGSAPGAAP